MAYSVLGHWGRRPPPPVPKYNSNLTNFWRRKCLVHNIMSINRNWPSFTTMKLLTTRKHSTVEWPKMHNLQNRIYNFSGGGYTSSVLVCLVLGASRFGLRTSQTEICVTIWIAIFVLENSTLDHPKNGSRRDGRIHSADLKKKWKLPLSVSRKFTLKNAKPHPLPAGPQIPGEGNPSPHHSPRPPYQRFVDNTLAPPCPHSWIRQWRKPPLRLNTRQNTQPLTVLPSCDDISR